MKYDMSHATTACVGSNFWHEKRLCRSQCSTKMQSNLSNMSFFIITADVDVLLSCVRLLGILICGAAPLLSGRSGPVDDTRRQRSSPLPPYRSQRPPPIIVHALCPSAANVWNTGHTPNHTASTAVGDANGLRQTTVEHDCAPESTRLPRTPMSPTQREGQTQTATPIYLSICACAR